MPKEAKTGVYQVIMEDSLGASDPKQRQQRTSGTFRVEEFRVPLMRASIEAAG